MRVNETAATRARRAQIVTAAIDTIAELGYANASFARIASRAGISSTRLISYHFDDKADLVRAVVGAVLGEAAAFMGERMRSARDRTGLLTAYIQANLIFIAEHPAAIRAVIEIAAAARTGEGAPLVDPADADDPGARLATMFREGQEAGEFRTFDPHVMAVTLRAAIDAAAVQPDLDPHAYAAELVALFTRAIRKDEL
ncbi:HTH-type transcriptional regulator betI [Actinoplanes sp. SE50]|uniref:TetR/AcrR family transcriptional regulator n=1 Tax=unclassified Actinoplanes TaxID=2626549 RepID=UPI00023ECD52|nr:MULTISPECIES: TetR/AcrR family transcriptional regulator [unclassified Actinoplanes]AEV86593.1 HTH-type transcriptional regulator betI [Actinoplanes sp. SE50/110]ATO84991.1 HTH-type transcriptional regulator betI [Actinoplanes sp. SE50]SLM02400.1 TetR family transcriptional regulator [Actinoplanes sp. SE50/110]